MPINYFRHTPQYNFGSSMKFYNMELVDGNGKTIAHQILPVNQENKYNAHLARENNKLVDALALAGGLCSNIRLHDPLWRKVEGIDVENMQPDEIEQSIIGHAKRKINELKQTDFQWHRVMPSNGFYTQGDMDLSKMGLFRLVDCFDYLNAIASAPSLNEDQNKKARATLANIDKNPTQAKIFKRTGLHSLIEPFITVR